MTKTPEAAKLSIEELDTIDLEFDEKSAKALHPDDRLYLLKRKLTERPVSETAALLGGLLNSSADWMEQLSSIPRFDEIIDMDVTAFPAATAISSTVEVLEETIEFIQVVIDRFGAKK